MMAIDQTTVFGSGMGIGSGSTGTAKPPSRPEPPDASLFGAEMALASELPPLAFPTGSLALRGRVVTHDGTGAPDAFVALLRDEGDPSAAEPLYHAYTDADGRLRTLMPGAMPLAAGVYRLAFDSAAYFKGLGLETFYPRVIVEFTVAEGESHYHVPLLLSAFGYSTYRGT